MNIVTAIDFSPPTEYIIRVTRKLAKSMNAHVWLVHVAEPNPDFMGFEGGPDVVRHQIAKEFRQQHKELQGLADGLRAEHIETTALMIQGAIVDTVLEIAKKHQADLIITGSHNHGAVYDILVGSISAGILKQSTCPVTVVPATTVF